MMSTNMLKWDVPAVISSDDYSSDSDIVISDAFVGNRSAEEVISKPPKEITSEGALIKRAEMYQEYMKQIPIPSLRGSVIPFASWMGLGRSMKQLYGQPLHYLTNIQLRQWDRARISDGDEYQPLDAIFHPSKAEATVWLLEEIHRRTTSHDYVAKLWLSDPMHHAFVDSVFPKLGEA